MTTKTRTLTRLITILGLALLLPLGSAWAADEDMSSSVYLKFDPETGDFITVEDPSRTQSQQHQASSKQSASTDAGAAAGQTANPGAAATPAQENNPPPAQPDAAAPLSPVTIGIVIALLALVAGAIAWMRKNPEKQAT